MQGDTLGFVRIRQFELEGLGHLSALVADDAAGVAAVVDPRRDVDVYLAAAADADLRISYVAETHLHNDYVSGGRELAALTGATHVIGAGADLAYEHRPVHDNDAFDVGAMQFIALETPGHTPEHVVYSVVDRSRADDAAIMFTGGSLLVGSVGRTDLLGKDNAVPYATDLHRSLHEVVLRQEDYVGVYPTHGAGSLCSTGIASTPNSTIGYERRHNPMLQPTEVDEFVRVLLRDQPTYPRYFARMRPINQAGPRLIGPRLPEPHPMSVGEVKAAVAGGAVLVDARSPVGHALSHVPGSYSVPAGSSFGTWLGWVVEPDRPLVLILERSDDWDDLIRQAYRVGYENVAGHLQGGMEVWVEAGGPAESSGRLTVDQLATAVRTGGRDAPLVIDVRQANEYSRGHVPGSRHITAGDLPERLAELPRDRTIATICASGYRASVAAALLRRSGFTDVSWVANGVPSWEAAGYPIDVGGVDAESLTAPSGF
jgi:hydroxyacylglutathione hydrolase